MNSTERLLAVHRGQPTDRVPVSTYELVGWNPRSWENTQPSYASLMQFIREQTDCMYMTGVSVPNTRAGEVEATVERWDDGDQHVTRRTEHVGGRPLVTVSSQSDTVNTTWTREHPVKDLDDLRAYMAKPWAPGEADFSKLERTWRELAGTHGLPLVSVGDPICELADAFEFGSFTVHAITETDAISAAMDQLHERYLERLRRILAGPVRDVVFRVVGPEYATPPYLPPALFRRFVTRYDAEYVRMIQQAGGIARIHCHGKIGRVVDQIAEMAPDALDPIEPPPDGDIDVATLKQRLGATVCLTGGIELKHLEHSPSDDIARLTRAAIEAGKPGGRFIVMPTAAPINIPLEPKTEQNYRTFIETALAVGRY